MKAGFNCSQYDTIYGLAGIGQKWMVCNMRLGDDQPTMVLDWQDDIVSNAYTLVLRLSLVLSPSHSRVHTFTTPQHPAIHRDVVFLVTFAAPRKVVRALIHATGEPATPPNSSNQALPQVALSAKDDALAVLSSTIATAAPGSEARGFRLI